MSFPPLSFLFFSLHFFYFMVQLQFCKEWQNYRIPFASALVDALEDCLLANTNTHTYTKTHSSIKREKLRERERKKKGKFAQWPMAFLCMCLFLFLNTHEKYELNECIRRRRHCQIETRS